MDTGKVLCSLLERTPNGAVAKAIDLNPGEASGEKIDVSLSLNQVMAVLSPLMSVSTFPSVSIPV
jgi:hypothetical protein